MAGSAESHNSCPDCDRAFETDHGLRMHFGSVHDGTLPNRVCSEYGVEFYAAYEKRYCSDTCRHAGTSYSGADNPNYRGGKTVGTCELCDADFEYYPSAKTGVYCPECVQTEQWRTPPTATGQQNPRWNGGKQCRQCAVCGTTVERYPSDASEVTVCGEACRRKWLSEASRATDTRTGTAAVTVLTDEGGTRFDAARSNGTATAASSVTRRKRRSGETPTFTTSSPSGGSSTPTSTRKRTRTFLTTSCRCAFGAIGKRTSGRSRTSDFGI